MPVLVAFSVIVATAVPNLLPIKVYVPAGKNARVGPVSPGVNGVPHGTRSQTGAIGAKVNGFRLVRCAIIIRTCRPPGSVDPGQGNRLAPPHDGAVTSDCQYTTLVPFGDHRGSAIAFQFGSLTLPG